MSLLKYLMGGGEYIPRDMFKAVTYTGTGSEQAITGIGFKPDLVWIKSRGTAESNRVYDNLRGPMEELYTNGTNIETTYALGLQSFDEDGFTLGACNTGATNYTGYTYVAWCFKAGNTDGEENTEGSSDSIVSAGKNFSIVKYTGTGLVATIGHGLSTAPKMIIIKDLDNTSNWIAYHYDLGSDAYILFSSYAAPGTSDTTVWQDTDPTDSVFTLSGAAYGYNALGARNIAYCFTDLTGVSSTGTYTGNSSTTGPIVTCDFQPAFVMVKNITIGEKLNILQTRDLRYCCRSTCCYHSLLESECFSIHL